MTAARIVKGGNRWYWTCPCGATGWARTQPDALTDLEHHTTGGHTPPPARHATRLPTGGR